MAATPRLREMDGNKKPLKSPCAALEQESKSVGQKGQLFHNGRNGRETKAKLLDRQLIEPRVRLLPDPPSLLVYHLVLQPALKQTKHLLVLLHRREDLSMLLL